MQHSVGTYGWPWGILLAVAALPARPADAQRVDFVRDVRPILADKCFRCHGPDASTREADLRLDDPVSARADRGGYSAVVPGDPDSSEVVRRITSSDELERMPPPDSGKNLTEDQIALVRRWIDEGADWSVHWAYVSPQRHKPPPVQHTDWPFNWIDTFILARLESEGLEPSPDAEPTTLVRRLYFDLAGLPPRPEDVARFLEDRDPRRYEMLVDALLASPAWGERMAIYWLDLVRYADTVGYHGDQDHNISPYRDYVINALNEGLPFDQFTRQQLAGDLLPDANMDARIATGYNRVLQTSHEGGVQPKEYLAIYAADRVRNLSAVWMAATMGCAQCHDHKYDPFTMKDFYSLVSFFADVDEARHLTKGADRIPTERAPEIPVLTARERRVIDQIEKQIEQVRAKLAQCDASDTGQAQSLHEALARFEEQHQRWSQAARVSMITVAIEPRTIRVLPRGNWLDDSGPVVQPAVPEFLGQLSVHGPATRLDLANWLTDADEGIGLLTARVWANRLWYLLFGRGLTASLDDFGSQGQPPDHPELLDTLAHELVRSGWDVKHLVRLLVTSRTYRQSSRLTATLRQRDPENHLFARQGRFRLPAEMIRDNALAISGLLVRTLGGPSVKPYQPAGYYRHLNFPARTYQHDTDQRQWRRGLYIHWQRQFLHPMLKAFDAPSREECTASRPRSSTPLSALVLLNDPTFVEAARCFAQRILQESGPDFHAHLRFATQTALSRDPDPYEMSLLQELYQDSLLRYQQDPAAARQLLAIGQAPRNNDPDPVQCAAWTTVARALLNLAETNTRN